MSRKMNAKRFAAMMIAVIFTFVTVIGACTVPTYAASKKPAKVKSFNAYAASSSSIELTWKKAKNAKKYQIYRATKKKGKYKKIATVKTTSFTNTDLQAGKNYYYKVRALNGKKKGSYSAIKKAKTPEQTIAVNKTVSFNCTVNGKYFTESTRHFIVDKVGFNAGKAILNADISPADLYAALVQAGGVSWSKSRDKALQDGEKISAANAENPNFSHVDVTVSWGGNTYPLNEVLTYTPGGTEGPAVDMVFSGNPSAAEKTPSGCIACLDSCYIGIVSNMNLGLCVIDNKNPAVYARADRLPPDGGIVTVNITVK